MFIFLLILQLVTISIANVLPDELGKPCKVSNPKLNDCLLKKLEKARPYIMKGIREINLRGLDPLLIPYFLVDNQVGDLVRINATVTNVRIEGIKNAVFQDVNFDPKNMVLVGNFFFPSIQAEFDYDVFGKLLNIPLENKGHFEGNASNIPLQAKLYMSKKNRGDEEYFNIKKMDVKSTVPDGSVKLISKNPNFQVAANVITDFFNGNPRLVLDAVNPIFVEAAAQFFTAFFKPVFAKIPIKELITE